MSEKKSRLTVYTALASCVSLEAIPDLHSCKSGYGQPLNDMTKDLCQQSEPSPDPLHLSSENWDQSLPLHGKTKLTL